MFIKKLPTELLATLLTFSFIFSAVAFSPEIINESKKGIVNIRIVVHKTAYGSLGQSFGTGILVNKQKGIILTNEHIASKKDVANYDVTFYNGRKAEAKFIYNDPHVDFAFIQVDPEEIPEDVKELEVSNKEITTDENVLMIGNNQKQEFSTQTGTIVSKYRSEGDFANQSVVISLNTRGGSSGSPVLNKDGEVVALVFSADETYCNAVNIDYIKDALPYIYSNNTPPRNDVGVIIDYYSADDAVKFFNLPKNLLSDYTKKYPDAFNNMLIITSIYQDSAANKILLPGDILWNINGEDIGPNLYKMQKIINKSKKGSINFTVYREGKLINVDVPIYDANKANDISKMVLFGGETFFESNDLYRFLSGAKLKTVVVSRAPEGGSFSNLPSAYGNNELVKRISIISLDNLSIKSLDDLIVSIPNLVKKKNFIIKYKNDFIYDYLYNSQIRTTNSDQFAEVEYLDYNDEPVILEFNNDKNIWKTKKILK